MINLDKLGLEVVSVKRTICKRWLAQTPIIKSDALIKVNKANELCTVTFYGNQNYYITRLSTGQKIESSGTLKHAIGYINWLYKTAY